MHELGATYRPIRVCLLAVVDSQPTTPERQAPENLGEIKPRILEGITTKIKASAKRRSTLRRSPSHTATGVVLAARGLDLNHLAGRIQRSIDSNSSADVLGHFVLMVNIVCFSR